ncbi:hypothetical protein CROQUDRAFT_52589 [Cronartium quercuum f. sp. fusiforme G11]|uniref:SAM domain-containing protein n=1 Tax=Cronartium quercuum f. sp. fusiforme G11 TaxID=708437 RepID=A0A9P6NBT8_9BASI|nr:hypothetical protein CROQUDRAFT_52589 [Cronartium quercuum f. sp. fusiforme G11]
MYSTASPSSFEEDYQSMSTTSSSASSNPLTRDTSMAASFFNSVTSPTLWSEKDVKYWLETVGYPDVAHVSEENGIDGAVLMHLDSESLRDLGIIKVGRRLRLIRLINQLETYGHSPSILYDEEPMDVKATAKLRLEGHVLSTFHNQDERIRQLEDDLWELRALTNILRERSNSPASFNSRASTMGPTLETSAGTPRSIHTPPASKSHTQAPPVFVTRPHKKAPNQRDESSISKLDSYQPSSLPANPERRRSISHSNECEVGQDAFNSASGSGPSSNQNNLTPKSRHQFSSTGQIQSSTATNPWCRNPALSTPNLNRQSSHSLFELRKKFSAPNLQPHSASDLSPGIQTPKPTSNSNHAQPAMMVARKPSLLGRSSRSPKLGGTGGAHKGLSYGSDSMSPDDMLEEILQTVDAKSQAEHEMSARSASTTKLRTAQSVPSFQQHLSTETSVRVKSNNAETVIEVLMNHLSSFYVNDPHAWSKHVLIVRKQQSGEHSLSYDEIPLKVYRSFKSREGVDFAIRSVEELPSPLRSIKASRKREKKAVSSEPLAVENVTEGEDKLEAARRPLPFGLAICGYQSEIEDELSIKPGQTFKIKDKFKTRYLVERDCNPISATSPLSAITSSASSICSGSPSPTRTINSNDTTGWVPQSCILETSQSIASFAPNGVSSLKHLISNPIKTSNDIFDQSRSTSPKTCLISFQTLSLSWSGELLHLKQGEILRAFNNKTRSHWTYCLRELTGERGWVPNWILTSNMQVFSSGPTKLRQHLRDQQSSIGLSDRTGPSEVSPGKVTGSLRSGSLHASPGKPHGSSRLAGQLIDEDLTKFIGSTSNLQRSATVGEMHTMNFTPRSRRSRINPI